MENWNQVQATVSIDGEECKYTNLRLHQLFNGHHTFDVSILCPPLKGQSIWYHERETVIKQQGKTVVIRMKHEKSEEETIFKGIITSIGMDGEQGVSGTLHYRGHSHTILLESGKTMDSFVDYTLQQIVDEVVSKYGNGIKVSNNPLFKDQLPYIQMHEESGYEFLRRLAYQYGEWFYYNGMELVFGKPQRDKTETLIYDIDTDLLQFGSQILPFQYSRHDYMPEYNDILYGDDADDTTGINTHMACALQASDKVYNSPTTLYNHSIPGHPAHIDRFLDAEKGRDTASLTWLSGATKTCRVHVGEAVDVEIPACMCERENLGRYRVMEVTHTVDSIGVYSNTFRGFPASMQYLPVENITLPVARPALATVMSNADPRNKGRVQVQFKWQESDKKTTDWIRVRSLDAGSSSSIAKNRGFVFIPEVGDQVLIDFELGNPSRPFVSGSMFHGRNGKGGETGNHLKSIITSSGHTLEFDDDQKGNWGITIKDASGCMFHFDTKGKNIEITAPERISLAAKNIELVAAEDIKLAAERNIESSSKEKSIFASKDDFSIHSEKELALDASGSASVVASEELSLQGQESTLSGQTSVTVAGQQTLVEGKQVTIQGASHKLDVI